MEEVIMPFSEIVIAAGSKALVACLSQYIKYKLKNDCIEKQIITSVTDVVMQTGSDSLIKRASNKLFPQRTFQEKYSNICTLVFNKLIKEIKYETIFSEWVSNLASCRTSLEGANIEESLHYWFSRHPSKSPNIDNIINEFINDYNSLIDSEVQKDTELTFFFECFKNAKSIKEIEEKLSKNENQINDIKDIVSSGAEDIHQIKEYIFPNEEPINKKKYPLTTGIIERKVISYEYIQESTVYFHENEAKTLLDYCKEERLLVLLGDAGCGKTIVLKQLAAQLHDTEYYPIFISLSNYAGETIEELIQREYTKYDNIPLLLIFDAFDETRQEDRDIFARKINCYSENHSNDRIIISVRNNFYRFSDSDGGNSKFKEFKEVGLFPLTESDISSYVLGQKVDYSCFKNQIDSNNLHSLVYNPFYLCSLTKLMIKHGELPPKRDLMEEIIQDSFNFDSAKYRNPDIINQSKVKLNRLLQEIAFSMQLMRDKSTLSTDDYQCLLEEESDRDLLQHSALFTAINNEQWRFEHNNFREYLAAKYLAQQDFETIKNVLCSDKGHTKIRESWLNVISYLVLIYDNDELLEWLSEISPELLVKFEPSRIDEKDRNQLFKRIFDQYSNKNMYITRGINDLEVLVKFSCTEEMLLFLIDYIDNGSTIWEKVNAIKLISYFERSLYNHEERIRSLLLNNISAGNDYLKATSIEAMGKLKLGIPEITEVIIKQLDELSADSDDSGYIKYMIVKYIIDSDLYEEYIDLLLKIQEQALFHRINYCLGIEDKINTIYSKIKTPKAVASIIKSFAEPTFECYGDVHKENYKLILQKAANFYIEGDSSFLDIVIEAMPDSRYSLYHLDGIISIYKDFFIETETLSIAIEKLLTESNKDNQRILTKAEFFKLFCEEDEVFSALRDCFYSEPNKNKDYIYEVLKGLRYNPTRYNDYCTLLIEKGFLPPQAPVDYNKIRNAGLQEFFNSLFNKEDFQKLIDELILVLNDNTLTYDNVNEKFFEQCDPSNSIQKEKLRNVVWAIKFAKFKERNIKSFVSNIKNWNYFCITHVVNILANQRQTISVSEKQKKSIEDFCKSLDIEQIINNEIIEEGISSIKYSHRAYYLCFLSKYFNITYDIDTYKKMAMIPKELFRDESHDNQAFPQYITEHLAENELNECVKANLENEALSMHAKISHIQYCKEKHLDYAIDAAEQLCLNAGIPDYYKKEALEYLIDIKKDINFDYICNKFLGTNDEKLLNAMIQVASSENNLQLIKKLEDYNSISTDKTIFLIPLINMQSSYALEAYYSLAKEKMTLPDYDVEVSSLTEAISNVKYLELMPQIIKLKDLLFSDGFKDKSTFGLQNSLWKALRNIADNNSSAVICELNKCLDNPQISAEEKAFCNNIIEEINISMKYRLDIAWNIRDIKRFLKAHRV